MLATKLIVPITRRIHTNIFKFLLRDNQCGREACKNLKNVGKEKVTHKETCKEYENKLAKCPKRVKECKDSPQSPSKCGIRNITDEYHKACDDIMKRAENILENIQRTSSTMIDQLARDIESSKKSEQVMLQGMLHDIKKTLQKLLALDPMFGSHKRKSAMYLSNKIHQAFNDVEQNSIPQINRMIEIVDKLERDVSVCIDRAKSLIFSCKKCKTADSLTKCIDENTKYATKILDKASHCAQNSLNEMESLKRETLDYHKATLHCISRRCRKDSEKLLTHLNNCVLSVKNGKKGGSR